MRKAWVVVLVAALGCSTSTKREESQPDASATALATRDPVAIVAAVPALADHLGRGTSLRRSDGRLSIPSNRMSASLPVRASGPTRVAHPLLANVFLELAPLDVRDVEGRVEEGRVVYPDVAVDTDLLAIGEPGRVEELRVLRSPRAPNVARWRVTLGAGSKLRIVGNTIELLDASDRLRIQSEPVVAFDARGVRRGLSLRFEGGILEASLDTSGLAYPIVVDPAYFVPTATNPLRPRVPPLHGTLPSGKILSLGNGTILDFFDPATETWSDAPTYPIQLTWGVAAATLPSGKVFVAGNGPVGGGAPSAVVAQFTEGTGWQTLKSLNAGRHRHRLVVLGDGRPLVIGGVGSAGVLASAEYYTASFDSWTYTPNMATARQDAAALRLTKGTHAGKVLVLGGWNGTAYVNSAELYDPSTNTWSSGGTMFVARGEHTATELPSGKVLVVGGRDSSNSLSSVELWDPATTTFTTKATLPEVRAKHAAQLMPDGTVLVIGGVSTPTSTTSPNKKTFVFTTGETWTSGPTTSFLHAMPAVTPLSGGRLLVESDGKAELLMPDPTPCTTSTTCGGSTCIDGFCCDRPCTGACESCALPGKNGICTSLSGTPPPDPSRPKCAGNFACVSGVCGTSCTTTSGCATGHYCEGSSCVPKKAKGDACTNAEQCGTGFCVDGRCCDGACTGTCQACDLSIALGTCSNVTGAPRGTRSCPGFAACSAGACVTSCTSDLECLGGYYCASGTCTAKKANGSACTASTANQCLSGKCVDSVCCETDCTSNCMACDVTGSAGKCTAVASGAPHGTRTCAPYARCNAGACATTCSSDAECVTGSACIGGTCTGKKSNGNACTSTDECTSGFCVDGVCCDAACDAPCKACNLASAIGTCSSVDGAPDPRKKCSTGPCASVCKAGACSVQPKGTLCGTSTCAGATLTSGVCDGTSTACTSSAPVPCPGGLVCEDGVNCKTKCSVASDRVTGACDAASGLCGLLDGGIDAAPTDAEPSDAATDTGRPIAEAGPPLAETPKIAGEFQRCTKASECATGHCVEGVCCDKPCTERCHSCALLSSPGKCTLEPAGVDLKNECGAAYSCTGTCGPSGECIGAGSGTMCARNRCVSDNKGVGPAYCPAPGAKCAVDDAVPFDCGAYACEPAFGACRTSCTSSSDCSRGHVCDIPTRLCISDENPPDDGGCAVSSPGRASASGLCGLLLLAAIARRRRS